jgi:tetratricopeptide (TPR) repeat protein
MLPRAAPHFIGRERDLDLLDAIGRDATSVAVSTIVGPPGVGKTALAVRWAHQAADRFPDGQLFLQLRGHGPGLPVRPIEGLTSLLLGLGVPADQIPGDEGAAVGRYRSRLAGQRILLILDNAADADQVRPLLPPGPGSVVVVTSRERLTGLTALDGARPLSLGMLSPNDAVELLRAVLGQTGTAQDEAFLAELAGLCGRLPLALRITAAQLVEQSDRTIADHVAELHHDRLAVLAVAGDESAAVRPALAQAYRRLSPSAARLFGRLGLVAGPDLSVASAAALLGDEAGLAAEVLELLVAAHLVERREPDRFGLHDLVREYADEVVERDETAPARGAARQRYGRNLAGLADAAARQAFPSSLRLLTEAEEDHTAPFQERAAALSWLDQELPSLVALATTAGPAGDPELAPRLADALRAYFWLRHDSIHWREVAQAGLTAATGTGDSRGQAVATFSLGMAELNVSRYHESIVYLRQALSLSRSMDWPAAEAATLGNLGIAYSELHDVPHAIESYRKALAVNTALGRTTGRANNLGNLGLLQLRVGQFRAAAEHLTEATTVHKGLGGGYHFMVFLHGLAQAERVLGRFDDARAHLDEALAAVRELDDVEMEAVILAELSVLRLDLGDLDSAREAAETALRLVAGVNDPDVRAVILTAQATVSAEAGNAERADIEAQQAIVAATESGNPSLWVPAMTCAALIALRLGRPATARDQAKAAVDRAARTGLRDLEAVALTALAQARLVLGEPAARADALRAASQHRETGHRLGEVRALFVADQAAGPEDGHRRAALDILAGLPGAVTARSGDRPG